MPEFFFRLRQSIELELPIGIKAADADAAYQEAWAQLGTIGLLADLPAEAKTSRRLLSQSILLSQQVEEEAELQAQRHPPAQSMAHYGRLMLTAAVNSWIHSEAQEQIPREMHVRQCLSRHLQGEDGDIHPDDAQLNAHTRHAPGDGGRLMSVWRDEIHPVLWIVTDAYASPEAVTTVLFPDDY